VILNKYKQNISKRLQHEIKRTFWGSGLLRTGKPDIRRAWIFQRIVEHSNYNIVNPFIKNI